MYWMDVLTTFKYKHCIFIAKENVKYYVITIFVKLPFYHFIHKF